MIILDTNVLSEVIRPVPDARVADWLERQPREATFATAISRAEMLAGVAVLPDGARRNMLGRLVHRLFESQFDDSLLPFDRQAADRYGELIARRRALGRPIGTMDALIAAVALSCGTAIATRNIADFEELGLDLVDPWVA